MLVSAVIPVLDEAARAGGCVRAVKALPGVWEAVVVDGGSEDGTVAAARAAGADRILTAQRGRGSQLRAGAHAASGQVLLFLHADARLPQDAYAAVEETVAAARWSGGAFRIRHCAGGTSGPVLRALLPLADLRSRFTGLPYGDQALFVTRELYRQAGGFPPQPLMEDVEFARRLRRLGPLRRIPLTVEVSARRFEQAPWRTFFCWHLFPTLYRFGVPPERLARWYGTPREAVV